MFDFASYHRAATLADAINLLADNPQAKLLAGGTDVLIQLHHHNDRYRHIVDIHNLAEPAGNYAGGRWLATYRLCNDIYPANRRSYNSTSSPGVMCCGHVHCWTADP